MVLSFRIVYTFNYILCNTCKFVIVYTLTSVCPFVTSELRVKWVSFTAVQRLCLEGYVIQYHSFITHSCTLEIWILWLVIKWTKTCFYLKRLSLLHVFYFKTLFCYLFISNFVQWNASVHLYMYIYLYKVLEFITFDCLCETFICWI